MARHHLRIGLTGDCKPFSDLDPAKGRLSGRDVDQYLHVKQLDGSYAAALKSWVE